MFLYQSVSFWNVRRSCDKCDSSFFSFCVEPRRSAENDSQCCEVPGFLKLGWSSKQFPKVDTIWLSVIIWRCALFNKDLKLLVGTPSEMSLLSFFQLQPVFSDLEHLRDQHLLLSVKSCDGFESYGTWSSLSCRFEWSSQKQWFGF